MCGTADIDLALETDLLCIQDDFLTSMTVHLRTANGTVAALVQGSDHVDPSVRRCEQLVMG